RIATLTREATKPGGGPGGYPAAINTAGKRALYNNLGKDATLSLLVDKAVQESRQDGWRSNTMKTRRVRNAIKAVLKQAFLEAQPAGFTGIREGRAEYSVEAEATRILELVKHQNDY
ncbi:MAG: restriction endonuclease subunit R, partial [Acidobacteria bacterium]|nr:restriction endonuclease subunit R [Acidobacteriota bacterium]